MNATVVATDCCAWPVLVRLPDAALGLVFHNRPSHGLVESDLATLVSTDHGATWRDAGLAATHAPGANRMHLASGLDHAGNWLVLSTGFALPPEGGYGALQPLWLSCAAGNVADAASSDPDASSNAGPSSSSDSNSNSNSKAGTENEPPKPRHRHGLQLEPGPACWRENREVGRDPVLAGSIPHGRILALPDGRLAATFYRSEGRDRPSRSWVAFSRDGGANWIDPREVGDGDSNEVVLLRRDATDWLAVARTHVEHHLTLHASNDEAATWSFRRDLTLPLQHPGDLTDLGDGTILLTYGIRNRGLMAIGARLSRDGGKKWGPPAVLYIFGDATDCGYPSTQLCADGSLLTACYTDHSPLHHGYHLLALSWRLEEFTRPRPTAGTSASS